MSRASSPEAVIRVRDATRIYTTGSVEVHAVKGVTLDIARGQFTAIVGRSGSGKTTLLNMISGLDTPTDGEIWFEGQRLDQMSQQKLLKLRLEAMGFVFQAFGLLPLLTAAENVGVPLRMRHTTPRERDQRIAQALEWVGLSHRAKHRPHELSGGEQQRVAIARALVTNPRVVMADEPTGQLDSQRGRQIIELMRRLVVDRGITLVIVTHDPQVMHEADIVHELRDGRLIETRAKAPLPFSLD